MDKVDVREFPRTGDQQAVITKDNVSLWVSATIFCQVTDVKLALFEVNDFGLAIDQMARTALRAVFGELTLDESLSERETINSKMQDHMAEATLKWGVRLNRIEILDITPPTNVLQAMSEQKEAEQHKRAAILKSEGEQQAAINSAQGRKQANVLEAEGQKQAAILAAEAQKQALELRADGEKRATQLRGEGEAAALNAIDTSVIHPNTLAIMQLRALQALATVAQRQDRRPLRGGRSGRCGPGAGGRHEGRRRSRGRGGERQRQDAVAAHRRRFVAPADQQEPDARKPGVRGGGSPTLDLVWLLNRSYLCGRGSPCVKLRSRVTGFGSRSLRSGCTSVLCHLAQAVPGGRSHSRQTFLSKSSPAEVAPWCSTAFGLVLGVGMPSRDCHTRRQ